MNGKYKAFWLHDNETLEVIDQRVLPFEKKTVILKSSDDCIEAIKNMTIRGAGVIGNIAAFGVYFAAKESGGYDEVFEKKAKLIKKSRPTAVNLMWAVDKMVQVAQKTTKDNIVKRLKKEAISISDEDCIRSKKIANYGADIFENIMKKKQKTSINVLTHCNAGWLAIVDDGSALAPIYEAKRRGIDIHVWVDETRPRNQGANLTAWELEQSNIKHTVIVDNVGGHLMQNDQVDVCITGADRVASNGDSANKIGTYLKALAAYDNNIPFYIALPTSTFDLGIKNGLHDIPIEIRDENEVRFINNTQIIPTNSPVLNVGFDVTPAKLITALITEKGVCKANFQSIKELFDD